MLPELGQFILILALSVALLQAVIPAVGVRHGRREWAGLARPAAYLQFCLVSGAYGILTYSFIVHDFSVLYVANTSNSELPLVYRISGVWGAHEGSLLLWVLILAGWTAVFAVRGKHYAEHLTAGVISVMGCISSCFLAFTIFTSNPFIRLFPAAVDGADLNPLLQDPAMAIHPPMLYMGYVGFSVPFAFAIVALVQGRLDTAWARWLRPWALTAWLCLTAGITLGSWWAYYELGWGGWWFWDPVENASFMPWLTGTALIHSLAVTEKRHALRNWTALLAIISFSLSLLGTFLVRSGILTSVHSFASDPTRGIFILAFLGLVIGISFTLFAIRAWQMRTVTTFRLVSREMALLANSVFLLIAMLTILLGTLYPLLLEALTGDKISVGPPYFNLVFIPLMVPVIILMAMGPLTRWREHFLSELTQILRRPAILAVTGATLVVFLLPGSATFMAWFALLLAFWVINSTWVNLQERLRHSRNLWHGLKRIPRGWYGMVSAHLGIVISIIGIALSGAYSQEMDVRLAPGEERSLGPYRFEFVRVEKKTGPNYRADVATINVYKDRTQVLTLYPEKRKYNARANVMTEASIHTNLVRDLYVSLGDERDRAAAAWTVRLYYKPFILWIWLGGLVMVTGGLLAVTDRRYRAVVNRQKPDPGATYAGTA